MLNADGNPQNKASASQQGQAGEDDPHAGNLPPGVLLVSGAGRSFILKVTICIQHLLRSV